MIENYKIESEFVTYDISLILKELGFNLPCLAKFCRYNPKDNVSLFPESQDFFKGYFNTCSNEFYTELDKFTAPTWSQIISWMKINHVLVSELWDGWEVAYEDEDFVFYETKEEAVLKGLEILKEKNK
jgi:hypothetical protein